MPIERVHSYIKIPSRHERIWPARSRSKHPLAANQKSRRLRRQTLRSFAPKLDLTKGFDLTTFQRRSDNGASLWTVEVALERESP